MNNSDLDKKLVSYPIPEHSPEYWEKFPVQVIERLGRAPAQPSRRGIEPRSPSWIPRLAWASGVAFACLVLGFALGHWHGAIQMNDSAALLMNQKMLREVMTMFPNRVRAIVQNEKGLQLVLSDEPDVPVSTPIWVRIGTGNEARTAVTFSGQEIQIGGEKITVLSDGKGGVILVGNDFAWSSSQQKKAGETRIEARPIGMTRL